ncbi:putative duf1445 domain protein [Phaeoacremonium minimum UCRPA7]|uniref:Putative duf1445 domain protein n=1 Tax=Phaeoacremonium minimum (strain UCR-PA7) TaxID=1286976 RepID=R8BPN8_PHAM7|nr:putative duf1445 domain protein [Phaeoacremonium minimum UCRPA7]EOO01304.1 putative duf1445 domain protein [Phaeoacremonium minimum UCRPA7]
MAKHAFTTGREARLAARDKSFKDQTSGIAPSYLQANLLVLPRRYADDFRLLCARNPVPCPLVAESAAPGDATQLKSHLKAPAAKSATNGQANGTLHTEDRPLDVAKDIDLRHDFSRYMVYKDGKLAHEAEDIAAEWSEDHVGFLIGCSFSFESALAQAGLAPRQQAQGRNVPMYRTTIPLCPAGVFVGGTYVVSMRPYRKADVEKVRDITRRFVATHGEPVAWGWDSLEKLGIKDITKPTWGQQSLRLDGTGAFDQSEEDYVPVFWGCGVTPQNAVAMANLQGTVMAHAPGHMIVLDVQEYEVFPTAIETA